jgi:hypothetical protein
MSTQRRFGDIEYIRFTNGVEESFIKLLEALKFIRLQGPGKKADKKTPAEE